MIEIHSTAIVEAIGRALGRNVSHVVKDLPDIAGLHLVKTITCDMGPSHAVLVRVALHFDWDNYRLVVKRDGERIAMITVPGTMTFPAIVAQAQALEKLISGVCASIDTSLVAWTYTFDPAAIERRGFEWIQKRLDCTSWTPERKARYQGFKLGQEVRQTLADNPHQSLSIQFSKEL